MMLHGCLELLSTISHCQKLYCFSLNSRDRNHTATFISLQAVEEPADGQLTADSLRNPRLWYYVF